MGLMFKGHPVDQAAREHAAGVVGALLGRTLRWESVPDALGTYHGLDHGVVVIHQELRQVADEAAATGTGHSDDLDGDLRRTERFLRSGLKYRWHHKGPMEIMGAYLGVSALSWVLVGIAGMALGFGNEIVIAGALFAMLLMVIAVGAMAMALMRRMWWRISARREGADRSVWPFFTPAEEQAAMGTPANGAAGA